MNAFVVKEYVDDGYSGGFLERPALDSLRDAVADGLFDIVIFHDADRMARKLIHQLILTEEFEKAGVHPVFVLEKFEDTPEGQMSYQMKGVFAEYERAKIRERTMRGKKAKLRAGKAVTDSHIYGYDFDKENSCYTINPAEAEIVKRVYNWYVNERVGGCEVIADMLNKEGVPTPTGKPGAQWGASTILHMLKRPHYTGKYFSNTTYHKKTGPRSYKKIPRPKEEWIPMTCPAIIPEEMHEKALAIKSGHRTYKTWSRSASPSLLQGVIVCSRCGHSMRISGGGKRNRRWYHCPNTSNCNGTGTCSARFSDVEATDDLFWAALEELCSSEEKLTEYIHSRIASGSAPATISGRAKRQKICKRLGKIQVERKAIMTWFSQSLIEQSDATEKLATLKKEETQLQAELSALEKSADAQGDDKIVPADICSAVMNCPATYEARRRVVLAVIDKVAVNRRDLNYGLKYIMDFDIRFK